MHVDRFTTDLASVRDRKNPIVPGPNVAAVSVVRIHERVARLDVCPTGLGAKVPFREVHRITVAVGTSIADRPPHRTVRARLRIRLPPWMGGDKAVHWIRMQDTGYWNPAVQNRFEPIPGSPVPLTATD